jgi:hypothetical protein
MKSPAKSNSRPQHSGVSPLRKLGKVGSLLSNDYSNFVSEKEFNYFQTPTVAASSTFRLASKVHGSKAAAQDAS